MPLIELELTTTMPVVTIAEKRYAIEPRTPKSILRIAVSGCSMTTANKDPRSINPVLVTAIMAMTCRAVAAPVATSTTVPIVEPSAAIRGIETFVLANVKLLGIAEEMFRKPDYTLDSLDLMVSMGREYMGRAGNWCLVPLPCPLSEYLEQSVISKDESGSSEFLNLPSHILER
jgi:hypothetical protein